MQIKYSTVFFLVQLLSAIQRLGTTNTKWTKLSNVRWVQPACWEVSCNTFHHQTQHIKPVTDWPVSSVSSLQKQKTNHFSFDRMACDSLLKESEFINTKTVNTRRFLQLYCYLGDHYRATLSTHFKQMPNGCQAVTPHSHTPPFLFTQGLIASIPHQFISRTSRQDVTERVPACPHCSHSV
jgi:hypothetical protein